MDRFIVHTCFCIPSSIASFLHPTAVPGRRQVQVPLSEARWTLSVAKNKLGKRLRRVRRQEADEVFCFFLF